MSSMVCWPILIYIHFWKCANFLVSYEKWLEFQIVLKYVHHLHSTAFTCHKRLLKFYILKSSNVLIKNSTRTHSNITKCFLNVTYNFLSPKLFDYQQVCIKDQKNLTNWRYLRQHLLNLKSPYKNQNLKLD
jgi:hypothetical protein